MIYNYFWYHLKFYFLPWIVNYKMNEHEKRKGIWPEITSSSISIGIYHTLWPWTSYFIFQVSILYLFELPCDPGIPLLGMYPERTTIQKDTCTPMSIAALFTIAKTWKQHQCPSPDEWIKKMWYIYTMEATRPLKMNEIMPFAVMWIDPRLLY